MKSREELEKYLAGIRRQIAEGEAVLREAEQRMAETDRFLAEQGLTREQVRNFRFTDEQRRLANEELKRRGLPALDEESESDRADAQDDLEDRVRKLRGMAGAMTP